MVLSAFFAFLRFFGRIVEHLNNSKIFCKDALAIIIYLFYYTSVLSKYITNKNFWGKVSENKKYYYLTTE